MNFSTLFGVIAALVVMVVSMVTASKNPMVFLDMHGIIIVLGGTAAAGLMCFPLKSYVRVGKVILNKFLGNYSTHFQTVIDEIVDLTKGYRENPDYLTLKVKSIKTPFLADAIELMIQGGISEDELDEILHKRAATHTRRYEYDAGVFKTLAKFPPAFGLLGTTLGMISLLQQLGGKDAQQMLGPAMAIGLVATFYGLTLSNLIFIPIAENLTMLNRDDETLRSIVIEGVIHIRQKAHPKLAEEHLKSYLLPNERKGAKSDSKLKKSS